MGWRLRPAGPFLPLPPPAQGHPPVARSFPPPCSCWEWRLHFSCHLHSQSIRTPQLSRLAELGGRWRRNGSSGGCRLGAAPIRPRLLPAPPCAAGEGAEPLELLLPPRNAAPRERARAGGPCWPSFSAGPARPQAPARGGRGRHVSCTGFSGSRRSSHAPPGSGRGAISLPPPLPAPETRRRGQGLGRKGFPSRRLLVSALRREGCHM